MRKKHVYKILINGNPSKNVRRFTYNYGSTSDIEISVSNKKVSIQYKMNVYKDALSIAKKPDNLVRDAMKKVFLVYVLLHEECIRLNSITIYIDDEEFLISDRDSAIYRIHTMMAGNKIDLPDFWKTDEFISYLLSSTKSSGEKDGRYSGICSFLVAESRKYEIDKFIGLWTAMNAYYSYFTYKGVDVMANKFGVDKVYFKNIADNDKKALSVMMLLFLNNAERPMVNTDKDKPEDKEAFRVIGDELAALDNSEIIKLYSESFKALKNKELAKTLKDRFKNNERSSKLKNLSGVAAYKSIEFFFLIVFLFPYLCRCNFVHGRKPVLITVFEDEYELAYIKKVNILLELFLKEHLPLSFSDYNFDDELIYDVFAKMPRDKNHCRKIREMKPSIFKPEC